MIKLPFELKPCPKECGAECGARIDKCPTYQQLPAPLKEVCQVNLHLLQYLHSTLEAGFGIP